MWNYEKRLQFPRENRLYQPCGGKGDHHPAGQPDGETAAAMRYLNQRYAMPNRHVAGLLTDIGTEELAHMEMIAAIVRQLTRNMTMEDVKKAGFDTYFVDHTGGIWPQAASGMPFSSMVFQSKGDAITDLFEDLAAEQKARTTYDNILRLVDIPDVREPIKFCASGRLPTSSVSARRCG